MTLTARLFISLGFERTVIFHFVAVAVNG